MANRVTATEVKQIITTTLSDEAIGVFITPANLLVTSKLGTLGMSDELLKEIERWLSAHFISIFLQSDKNDGGTMTRDKVGESEREWKVSQQFKENTLGMTNYGKQAVLLDTSGTLVDLGKRKVKITTLEVSQE